MTGLRRLEHLNRVKAHVSAPVADQRGALNTRPGRNLAIELYRLKVDDFFLPLRADAAPGVLVTNLALRVDSQSIQGGENLSLSHSSLPSSGGASMAQLRRERNGPRSGEFG